MSKKSKKSEVASDDLFTIELSSYIKPKLVEYKTQSRGYVLNGRFNSFYDYIDERYDGSPTNSAIIDGYVDRMYGKGLTVINANINAGDYARIMRLLPPKEVRKVLFDYKKYGSAIVQVQYGKGEKRTIATTAHLDRKCVAPSIMNEDGEIESYWFCQDFRRIQTFEPEEFMAYGTSKDDIEILEIRPYKSGRDYFADPDYMSGLQYAKLEEEIANFSVNHIMNGLSAGVVLNFNNGKPTTEVKKDIKRKVHNTLTGSGGAKIIFSFNETKDEGVTVEQLQSDNNTEQWQFWAGEARSQIMVAHKVVSPILFGVRTSTGLGNNANEIEEATKLLNQTVIAPRRMAIIEDFQRLLAFNDISSPLMFKPLEDEAEDIKEDGTEEEKQKIEMNKGFDPNQKRDRDGKWTKEIGGGRCSFKNWFKDSKVVDEDGNPKEFYHGTTHDFNEFSKDRGNIENDFGVGFYFSSESDDVGSNYAGLGPDLTNRVESMADRISSDREIDYEKAKDVAIKRLVGSNPRQIPVYISLQNPIIIGGKNETFFELDFDPETGEESGSYVDLVEAIRDVSYNFYDANADQAISDVFENAGYDYAGAESVVKALKQSEGFMYATDDNGYLATGEIIRSVFERMGFDGIIDRSVYDKFGRGRKLGRPMEGIYQDTEHVIAFEPNQIKSVDADSFCEDNNNIYLKKQLTKKPKTKNQKKKETFLSKIKKWFLGSPKSSPEALIAGADLLIELGEDPDTDFEIIETREVEGHSLHEHELNISLQLAGLIPGDARETSDQDTSLFKIRYQYKGELNYDKDGNLITRAFCQKLLKADKVYKYEDLVEAGNMVFQPGMGREGTDTYSILLYKGGVNCKHFWQRVVYLRKNNKRIGVNEARRLILELDPRDRQTAKWEKNRKEVAQIASKSNDFWRYNPKKKVDLNKGFDPNQPRAKDGKWSNEISGSEVSQYGYDLEKEIEGLKTLFISEKKGVLSLDMIEVEEKYRGTGLGSSIMNKLTDLADSNNWTIELIPAVADKDKGTTSRSRLVKFYKRFGFVENKGRNKDFTRRGGSMYRLPKKKNPFKLNKGFDPNQPRDKNGMWSENKRFVELENTLNDLIGNEIEDDQVNVKYPENPDELFYTEKIDSDFYLYIKDKFSGSQNNDGWSESGAHELFFYDKSDTPIGFAKLTKSKDVLSVNMIYLEPDVRGYGNGTTFYKKMLNNGFSFKSDSEITGGTESIYKNLAKEYPYKIQEGRVIIMPKRK